MDHAVKKKTHDRRDRRPVIDKRLYASQNYVISQSAEKFTARNESTTRWQRNICSMGGRRGISDKGEYVYFYLFGDAMQNHN